MSYSTQKDQRLYMRVVLFAENYFCAQQFSMFVCCISPPGVRRYNDSYINWENESGAQAMLCLPF